MSDWRAEVARRFDGTADKPGIDPEKAKAARAQATTTFPIRLEFPLGDGNWDKQYVTLLLHASGEVSWDAEGFTEREATELDAFFGPSEQGRTNAMSAHRHARMTELQNDPSPTAGREFWKLAAQDLEAGFWTLRRHIHERNGWTEGGSNP